MRSTIQDVARKAGVSTATVSRALRGLPNVSPATRHQVLQVAEELDYRIAPEISRQARGRHTIAIVIPLADQWFYSKLVSVAEIELMTLGCDVMRYSVDSIEGQLSLVRHLTARKLVDGLILCSLSLTPEMVSLLHKVGVAVATVETHVPDFPAVWIDNVAAAEMATRYLINLGHQHIGIITGLEEAPLQFAIPRDRKEGYLRALKQHGIEYRPELEEPGNYIYEGGAEAMKQLFSVHQPPTAVFAFSDEMAIGALKSVRAMNLRVPEDISIMGFDDNDVSEYVGLTTVRQPVSEYGEIAVAQIMAQLEGDEQEFESVACTAQLVVRATTGPLFSRQK
jgi:LacI family repressor for deo operon, udp, cdd, tsx, nupC, and nupG